MRSVLLFILAVFFSNNNLVFGQDGPLYPSGPLNILSPEAAGFAKNVNIPMNTYTGLPNISIPLFNITDGEISVPISLSYNGSGIRVTEEATWVGLGFSLNSGGQITRAIRGADDFTSLNPGSFWNYLDPTTLGNEPLFSNGNEGNLSQSVLVLPPPTGQHLPDDEGHIYLDTKTGQIDLLDIHFNPWNYDWMPDLFNFNAIKYSGRFVLDSNGNPMALNKSNIKITRFNGDKFQVIGDDGLIYTFDLEDRSASMMVPRPDVTSTWYLSKIQSANGDHVVTFKYAGGSTQTIVHSDVQAVETANGDISTTSIDNYNIISYWYPTEIDFGSGKVLFSSSTGRTDIIGGRRLDSVVMVDNSGRQIKKYSFKYSYFHSGTSTKGLTYTDRLKLDTIAINDDRNNSYKFDYNLSNVPSKDAGVDHWGYYNQTGFGIPKGIYGRNQIISGGSQTVYEQYPGADYEVHWPLTAAMTLNKITYPTGGYSKFTYESNEFSNVPDYWQYNIVDNTLTPVLVYPVNSVDNGSVPLTGTLNNGYNLYCHFYCSDPSILLNFYIDFINSSGTVITSRNLTQFTKVGNDYTLNANNIALSGTVTCKAYSSRTSYSTTPANFFLFFQLQVSPLPGQVPNSLVSKNLTRMSGGGLRVSEIINGDINGEVNYKKYSYDRSDGTTSGVLMNFPVYQHYPAYKEGPTFKPVYFSNNSIIGLSQSASGNSIGYGHVTETFGRGNTNIGSIEYVFSNAPDAQPMTYALGLPSTQTNENGLLLDQTEYDANHNKVKELVNTYNVFDGNWRGNTGCVFDSQLPWGSRPPIYFWREYQLDYKLLTKTETTYNNLDHLTSLHTDVEYQYSTNKNPARVINTLSTGDKEQVEYRYPDDFTSSTVPPFVKEMKDSNILDRPIEVINSRIVSGVNLATGGVLREYGTGANRGWPIREYKLVTSSPFSWSSTNFSSSLSTTSFLYNSNYILAKTFGYLNSNLIDFSDTRLNVGYKWEYNRQYPIVQTQNAMSTEFYTEDFEESTLSGVTSGVAHTGQNYFLGSFTVNWVRPNSRSYIITYWYRSSGTWKFSSPQAYSGSSFVLTGGDAYDDIRVFPKDAQLTSYTYKPLTGVSSESDMNSLATFYEYDSLQRLKNIKDYQGSIIKNYQYNYAQGCTNCSIPMQTFAGTPTISYPVGVFSVANKLLGNAKNQTQYDSLWNLDATNHAVGTLSAGSDSMHFTLVLNSGQTNPGFVTGCRYYQYDIAYNQIDAVRNINATCVDFGDGIGMRMGTSMNDSNVVVPANTQMIAYHPGWGNPYQVYFVHSYPDSSLKTITFYHNDRDEYQQLDNNYGPATSLVHLKNMRGYLPQNTTVLAGDCYQQSSALTTTGIINWNSINSITTFGLYTGDGTNPCLHVSYPQDFMAGNKNLQQILLDNLGPYQEGYEDTTFRISRLKSNWNTYFTNLTTLEITDKQWNREDLTALINLNTVGITPGNTLNSYTHTGNPLIAIPSTTIDNVIKQVWAGAGQHVYNGIINFPGNANTRTSASDAAVAGLKAKNWTILINSVAQ